MRGYVESHRQRLRAHTLGDFHFAQNLARLEVPGRESVSACRKARWNFKTPLAICDRKKWMLENSRVSKHPGMHIAHELEGQFGSLKPFCVHFRLIRLRNVKTVRRVHAGR